jgi:hypothetical protein
MNEYPANMPSFGASWQEATSVPMHIMIAIAGDSVDARERILTPLILAPLSYLYVALPETTLP